MAKPSVVIVGGGFAGMHTARRLARLHGSRELAITLVSESDTFLFTPLLTELVNDELVADDIQQSLAYCVGSAVKLVIGTVTAIDFDAQQIDTSNGVIDYDYLVLAIGSKTNYFNIPGAESHSFTFKTLADVQTIAERIDDIKQAASHAVNGAEDRNLKHTVIVGAGPSGSELAIKLRHRLGPHEQTTQIYLIDKLPELLPLVPPKERQKAAKLLHRHHVSVLLGKDVEVVTAEGIAFSDGTAIAANMVIWTAGVAPKLPRLSPRPRLDNAGRIIVDQQLRVSGHRNVFALGDVAHFETVNGKPLPPLAQVATRQAVVVAKNILHSLRQQPLVSFRFIPYASVVPLGRWNGVGKLGSIGLSGPIVWLAAKVVYAFGLPAWSKRLRILIGR